MNTSLWHLWPTYSLLFYSLSTHWRRRMLAMKNVGGECSRWRALEDEETVWGQGECWRTRRMFNEENVGGEECSTRRTFEVENVGRNIGRTLDEENARTSHPMIRVVFRKIKITIWKTWHKPHIKSSPSQCEFLNAIILRFCLLKILFQIQISLHSKLRITKRKFQHDPWWIKNNFYGGFLKLI